MIDLEPSHLTLIKKIAHSTLPHETIWAFGSRVNGSARRFSDLDLVIKTQKPLPWQSIEDLKDAFSLSDLPMSVDLIDWSVITPAFQKIILARYEVIQSRSET
jgi:uncharacterized protein